MIHKQYKVTGHLIDVSYTEREVEEIFQPLLETLTDLRKEKSERVIVYLAAPPGAGKTILSLILEELYKEQTFKYTFQSVSMDGFHHYNSYLKQHTVRKNNEDVKLKKYKGIPESFDLEKLEQKVRDLKTSASVQWPTYDRALHDVSSETVEVDADIVLVEGNYLLLDKAGWRRLKAQADYTVFIDATLDRLETRLIDRKQLGGASQKEAVEHYKKTDKVNAELVLKHSVDADLTLTLTPDGFTQEK